LRSAGSTEDCDAVQGLNFKEVLERMGKYKGVQESVVLCGESVEVCNWYEVSGLWESVVEFVGRYV